MNCRSCIILIGISTLLLSGCLKFGENIELTGAEITPQEIENMGARTGITFPVGTTGQNYYYHGDTMDPWFIARLVIPRADRDTFLKNDIFTQDEIRQPALGAFTKHSWWTPEALHNRMDGATPIPSSRNVEVFLGEHGSDLILLIHWWTM